MIITFRGRSVSVSGDQAIINWGRLSQGTLTGHTGILAATEPPDTAAIRGTIKATGQLATIEQPDASTIAGTVRATGILAATEPADSASIQGTTGNAAATGGIPKITRRHSRRYEVQLENGPRLIAPSLVTLQEKVAHWRAVHPVIPAKSQPAIEIAAPARILAPEPSGAEAVLGALPQKAAEHREAAAGRDYAAPLGIHEAAQAILAKQAVAQAQAEAALRFLAQDATAQAARLAEEQEEFELLCLLLSEDVPELTYLLDKAA